MRASLPSVSKKEREIGGAKKTNTIGCSGLRFSRALRIETLVKKSEHLLQLMCVLKRPNYLGLN